MTIRKVTQGIFGRSLALLTCLAVASGSAPGLFAQSSSATIAGVILDPSGHPAEGFKVSLRDVASNTEFTSGPTDVAGNYSVEVPVGGRYKLDNVVAADGVTKLPVQDIPPVSVLAAGTTRLNVRFTNVAASATPIAGATPATTDEEKKKKKKGAVPWYQRPGPIVGMVLGSVAVAALLLSGGSDASPYNP